MIVPGVLIALSTAFFGTVGVSKNPEVVRVTFSLVMIILVWQHWHFGKQNLGIYSFCRLATDGGAMLPVERSLMVAGAISGMLVIWDLSADSVLKTYASSWSFPDALKQVMIVFGRIGRILAGVVFVFSLTYVVRRRARFGWISGSVFLISANFFAPLYFFTDNPRISQMLATSLFAHGVQYAIVLVYHAMVRSKSNEESALTQTLPSAPLTRFLPMLIFSFVALACYDLYFTQRVISLNRGIQHLFADGLRKPLSNADLNGLSTGALFGILMSHFWIDAFLWRLRDKDAREWVRLRYPYLWPASLRREA